MQLRQRTFRRFAAGLAVALGFGLVGCTLTVDTDYLVAGEDGLECTSDEKICPLSADEPEGQKQCVAADSPQTGCARKSCSPCQLPGAVARCLSNGECGIAVCSERNEDCDNDETNGCEIDTSASIDNCGTCGRVCEQPNAVTACVDGVCEFVICAPPFADCDAARKNGCETNLDEDAQHCGDCETECAGNCIDGNCVP